MLFIECFNKNVLIGDEIVGYVNREGVIYISNKRFAILKDDGEIYIEKFKAGYISDGGDIYLNKKMLDISLLIMIFIFHQNM